MLALQVSERDFAADKLHFVPVSLTAKIPAHFTRGSITSVSSTGSTASYHSRLSAGSVASSRSSVTTCGSREFDVTPTLVKTPWELHRAKKYPGPVTRRRAATTRSLPSRTFEQLPKEVYHCILQQLEQSYFGAEEGGCITCYLEDIHSLALTNRNWCKAARLRLYGRVWLPIDETTNSKKSKGKAVHRIKLLRRTLRERPSLARLVTDLRIPDLQVAYGEADTKERQAMIDATASLIMACPNLERFTGLVLSYDHSFDRLTHALSTRTKLREKIWSLKRAEQGIDEEGNPIIFRKKLSGFGIENPDAFLNCHDNWPHLQSLLLFGQGSGSMDYRSFAATFRSLPSLRHLVISNFDAVEFNDRTLAALPLQLTSICLQDLPGVTDKGILKLSTVYCASTLQSVSLINLEIYSAIHLRQIFALPSLQRFVIVQDSSPTLPHGIIVRAPIYSSATLEFLHWDIRDYGPASIDLATALLHRHAFPKLTSIRAPSDHHGLLQNLCRPTGDVLLHSDRHLLKQLELDATLPGTLTIARHAAQYRIEKMRQRALMQIVVQDGDTVHHRYTLRDFMGRVDSRIDYVLAPDLSGSDEPIAGLGDLLRHGAVGKEHDLKAWCTGHGWAAGSASSSSSSSRGSADLKKPRVHLRRRRVRADGVGMMF